MWQFLRKYLTNGVSVFIGTFYGEGGLSQEDSGSCCVLFCSELGFSFVTQPHTSLPQI